MPKICSNCGKKIKFTENSYSLVYSDGCFCEECSPKIRKLLHDVYMMNEKNGMQVKEKFQNQLDSSSYSNETKELLEREFRNIYAENFRSSKKYRTFKASFETCRKAVIDAGYGKIRSMEESGTVNTGAARTETLLFENLLITTMNLILCVTISECQDKTSVIVMESGTTYSMTEKFWAAFFKKTPHLADLEITDFAFTGEDYTSQDLRQGKKRIGILGGTFDPVHLAHVALGKAAIKEAELDKLIVMPARMQPFKQGVKVADDIHRKNMVKIAFDGNDKVEVSDYEMNRGSLSYTIKTLEHIKEIYPDHEIFFISGTDSFMEIDTWYRGKDILRSFSLAVCTRPGYSEDQLWDKIKEYEEKYGTEVVMIKEKMPSVSSTLVRKLLSEGKPVTDLVPEQVERYIMSNGLYK